MNGGHLTVDVQRGIRIGHGSADQKFETIYFVFGNVLGLWDLGETGWKSDSLD